MTAVPEHAVVRGATAAMVVSAAIAAAHPGNAAEASRNEIEEIIVTATRRDLSANDVPFNVAALSGDAVDDLRVADLRDLAGLVPGLTVVDQGLRAASRLTVRGLNVASLNESAVLFNSGGGAVATYVGDIPVYVDLRPRDLERVEVLLGPQGTLYGAGTLGGAIRYIPMRPQFTGLEGEVAIGGFRQDGSDAPGSDVWGVVNFPILDDKLAARVSAFRFDDPGFVDYPYLVREAGVSDPNPDFDDPTQVASNLRRQPDADAGSITGARAALSWRPTENVLVNASYSLQETDFGGRTVNHRFALGTGRREAAHRVPEPNRRRNEIVSLEVSADLGFAELISATGVTTYGDAGQRDGTDLLLSLGFGAEFPNFVVVARDRTDEDRLSQEFRLVSKHGTAWDWIAGVFLNDYDFAHAFSELGPGYAEFLGINRPDGLLSVIRLEESYDERAAFGELGWRPTERWRVALGARHFRSTRTNANATDFPLFNTLDGLAGPDDITLDLQSFELDDQGTLFKFSSSLELGDDTLGYLTVSEGYRPGGVNPFARCPAPVGCLRPNEVLYEPDTTLNYELGFKGTLKNIPVRFNAAIYQVDWRDIQLDTISEDLFFIRINGGDARSRGAELSVDTTFGDRVRASLVYAFNEARLTTFTPRLVDGIADAFEEDRLPGTPEHQGALRLDYRAPLAGNWNMVAGYTLTATGDVYTKVGLRNNGERLPGFAIHDLAVTFSHSSQWSIRLFVDNVFDRFAESNTRADASFVRNVGVHPLRSYFRNVVSPRRYGLEARYNFSAGQ